MKCHQFTVFFLDYENYGKDTAGRILESDRDFSGKVIFDKTRDIGEWSDDHPLNLRKTDFKEYFVPKTRLLNDMELSDEATKMMQEAVTACEATSSEKYLLWHIHWHNVDTRYKINQIKSWEEISLGFFFQIGIIADMPVMLSVWFARIEGRVVMFYESTGQATDWRQIENWIEVNLPHLNGKRHDTSNFWSCIHDIRRLNGEE